MRIGGVEGSKIPRLREKQLDKVRTESTDGQDFKDMVTDYVSEVDDLQDKADKALEDIASGRTDNVHRLSVATSEAELSFRMMMKTRDKLVEAYNEIMKMQVG